MEQRQAIVDVLDLLTPARIFMNFGVSDIAGSITPGKLANLIITKKIPSLTWIPYCWQTPFISKVLLRGREV